VLVDLNAYSTTTRLGLFLKPPAPLTLGWFNLYATSGLPGYQVIVGDRVVVRPEEERGFSERVACLPLTYLAFEVTQAVPPVRPPPCQRLGRVTFGSLVSQSKITGPVLDAWAEILRQTTDSELVLANAVLRSPHNREYVLDLFRQRGVVADRIRFLNPAPHLEFLAYYDAMDVALDAFPYNGGTTTMEALWQGVPVLTTAGDRWAARTSQSLLQSAGLEEYVARDVADYVATACRIARDRDTASRLGALRHGLRDRLRAAPVCATARLARYMERLYRRLGPA
jgi:predicted O-linked N-acetylglucosamine transferase (SPINDLY family)